MDEGVALAGSVPAPGTMRAVPFGGRPYRPPAALAAEVPLSLVYGGLPFAVMMVTPSDLKDFVVGFSLSEGVIADPSEIRGLSVRERRDGIVASVDLAGLALARHLARRRSLHGRTGCGLCGVEDLEQLPAAAPVRRAPPPSPQALQRALDELGRHQPLHRISHAMHAAAWCGGDGRVLLAREDVGRHNSLDKLIGACLRAGLGPEGGFALITSRCSFEMVEKAAAFGAPALVAVSAPTSLAVERAAALGLTLLTMAGGGGATLFPPIEADMPA